MHVEVRTEGNGRKYYAAHAYRKAGKVHKVRLYLGANLSPSQIQEKLILAEEKLSAKTLERKQLSDPLQTVLSKSELDELKTLQAKGVPSIAHLSESDWRQFTEAFTFDTNAIEGSTVASKEVGEILEKNKWPDKSKADIAETYGVSNAVAYLRTTKDPLSVDLILTLHRIVFANSKSFAGRFRPKGVEVVVADRLGNVIHRGAPATHVQPLLIELTHWYSAHRKKYPALVLAAVVHNQFETIYPFEDGNGRVGRLLLNYVLLKNGLPPLNIELKHRHEYYASLQAYQKHHDLRPTIELMLKEYRALKKLLDR